MYQARRNSWTIHLVCPSEGGEINASSTIEGNSKRLRSCSPTKIAWPRILGKPTTPSVAPATYLSSTTIASINPAFYAHPFQQIFCRQATPPDQSHARRWGHHRLPLSPSIMAVCNVQVFGLAVASQFQGLTVTEKRYAHHMARYVVLSP